jgi:hypothetical protein
MAGGFEAVGPRPFSFDPGSIRPEILRAMWLTVCGQLPEPVARRLEATCRQVGMASVLVALLSPGRSLDRFIQAIESALAKIDQHGPAFRRAGSDLCLGALTGAFVLSGCRVPDISAQLLVPGPAPAPKGP